MTVNCQWIERNLEALFCDGLTEDETRVARAHIENCSSCSVEVQTLDAIDPLVKAYFRRELTVAGRPRAVNKGRAIAISGTVAAVAVLSLLLLIRTTPAIHSENPVLLPNQAPVTSVEPTKPIKADDTGEIIRAKPAADPGAPVDRNPQVLPAVPANASEFLVSDPAGYSHTLEEYRGHVVVIGVWSAGQPDSIDAIERLYKTYAGDTKLRFLGVSRQHQPKPANTTFPVLYNQGSKLFGAEPGEFVLLDETGRVAVRGSLVKDFDVVRKFLDSK